MLRPRLLPPRDVFPIKPWSLETTRFHKEFRAEAETGFALANGYLGIRGSHEEGHPVSGPGTFINGFYELRPIIYGEEAYGFPKDGQTMLNCPDGTLLRLYIDDEPFDLESADCQSYRRTLDMRRGVLERDVEWRIPSGKTFRLRTTRLVSFADRHLAAIEYELHLADADVVISSELVNRSPIESQSGDPRLAQGFAGRPLKPAGYATGERRAILSYRTERSE